MKIYMHEDFDYRGALPRTLWPYWEDAAYLLHVVYQHGLLRHGAENRKDRAVNLKYDYLVKVIDDRHFTQIRTALEKSKWLKCDHESEEGVKAFTYWLGKNATKGHFRQEALTKTRLITKIDDWKRDRLLELTPAMKHIVQFLPEITLDETVADALIQQGGLSSRQALEEQFTFIRNGTWFHTPCEAGRLYSNITSLRSDGRGALRVNGRGLNNVDVSDSQFLALVILIENAFYGRPLDYIKSASVMKAINDPLLAVDPFTIVPHFSGTEPFVSRVLLFPLIPEIVQKKKYKGSGRRREERGLTTCTKLKKTPIQGQGKLVAFHFVSLG